MVPYWIGRPGRSARPTIVNELALESLAMPASAETPRMDLDLGAGHGLAVGDDREGLERGLAQLHRRGLLAQDADPAGKRGWVASR